MIAPGLPRQRLDGLEIIVHCECEENDSTTISDEVSEESTCLKRKSKVQPSCLESACQTSTCDFSMSTPCSKEPNMTTNGACPIADTICNTSEGYVTSSPNLNTTLSQAITQQAWLKYSQKSYNFANAEEQCAALEAAQEIWTHMTSQQKMPYYWEAVEHGALSLSPFDNFLNFYQMRRSITSPRARAKIEKTWKGMSFEEKLPFIVESFIYKLIDEGNELDQASVKSFFDRYRRQSKRVCACVRE